MKFNKCVRCGAFFASEDCVCPNCLGKDEVDKSSLRNYLQNNEMPNSVESLAFSSGISLKNITRFLDTQEFSSLKQSFEETSLPKIDL